MENTRHQFCYPCAIGCGICGDGLPCVSCVKGYSLNVTNGVCYCPLGSYQLTGFCMPVCPDAYFKNDALGTCDACGFKC